jgi:hypothetical protein
MTTITVTRQRMATRFGESWHYYATGPDTIQMPDGRVLPRKFDNSSYAELRKVLRKRYGRDTRLVADWKPELRRPAWDNSFD